MGPLSHRHVDVKNCGDPLHRDMCLRDRVGHLREVLYRLEEPPKISEEYGQRANGQRAVERESRPSKQDERRARRHDGVDERRQE